MLELIIAIFVFGTVFLGMQRATRRSPRAVAHLSRHQVVMPGIGGGILARPKTAIFAPGSGGRFTGWATKIVRQEARSKTERLLIQAGNPMPLASFLVVRTLFAFGLTPIFLFWALQQGLTRNNIIMAGFGLIFLPVMPHVWLKRKARKRTREVEMVMPDALDLMVVCVEGGLSIDGALQQVARRTGGVLASELTRMLSDVSNGVSRRDAFTALSNRSQSQSLNTFCTTIIQADKLGMSIAATLRTTVETMRTKRRQHAETQARKAPIKMLPILAVFMMPSLFIVILGPMVLSMMEFFGSMGV